jgi:hypothetical protein
VTSSALPRICDIVLSARFEKPDAVKGEGWHKGFDSITMHVEHILLASADDEPVNEISGGGLRVDNARLEQRSWLRRSKMCFVRFNRHYLAIDVDGPGSKQRRHELDLAFLDPRPRRVRRVSNGLLSAALGLTVGAVAGTLYGGAEVGSMLSVAAAVALLLAILRSCDRIVFYSRHGRVPLVVMFNRNPDPGRFRAFVDDLIQHIQSASGRFPDRNQKLSAELREHRRLMAEGVLSARRYEIVKQRLLACYR